MLLLLLSRISHVRLCATPQTAAYQAPLSLEFSRQEYWSGLPLPSPVHESKSENEAAQSCLTLRNPMDCSLPGSSVHEVFQARVLEWGVISSSPTSTFTLILCFQAFLLAVYLWPLLAREPLPWRQSSALTIFTQHLPPCLAHRGHSVHLCSGWTTAINS